MSLLGDISVCTPHYYDSGQAPHPSPLPHWGEGTSETGSQGRGRGTFPAWTRATYRGTCHAFRRFVTSCNGQHQPYATAGRGTSPRATLFSAVTPAIPGTRRRPHPRSGGQAPALHYSVPSRRRFPAPGVIHIHGAGDEPPRYIIQCRHAGDSRHPASSTSTGRGTSPRATLFSAVTPAIPGTRRRPHPRSGGQAPALHYSVPSRRRFPAPGVVHIHGAGDEPPRYIIQCRHAGDSRHPASSTSTERGTSPRATLFSAVTPAIPGTRRHPHPRSGGRASALHYSVPSILRLLRPRHTLKYSPRRHLTTSGEQSFDQFLKRGFHFGVLSAYCI